MDGYAVIAAACEEGNRNGSSASNRRGLIVAFGIEPGEAVPSVHRRADSSGRGRRRNAGRRARRRRGDFREYESRIGRIHSPARFAT